MSLYSVPPPPTRLISSAPLQASSAHDFLSSFLAATGEHRIPGSHDEDVVTNLRRIEQALVGVYIPRPPLRDGDGDGGDGSLGEDLARGRMDGTGVGQTAPAAAGAAVVRRDPAMEEREEERDESGRLGDMSNEDVEDTVTGTVNGTVVVDKAQRKSDKKARRQEEKKLRAQQRKNAKGGGQSN